VQTQRSTGRGNKIQAHDIGGDPEKDGCGSEGAQGKGETAEAGGICYPHSSPHLRQSEHRQTLDPSDAGYIISENVSNSSEQFAVWRLAMAMIHLAINGRPSTVNADPQTSLLTVLREQLDLTGTKYGCGEGQCGACTVLIDGKAQRSCITRVETVAQKQITTIEGLASGEELHPMQEAFLAEGAMQCGYCTPGMIMSAVALVSRNHHPTQREIIDFMDGNICRCGVYSRIISAIQKAAKMAGSEATKGARQ
jgi:aerobic-type carbon monoxide dehydrogenase small subunit (CoxS/CutS family)